VIRNAEQVPAVQRLADAALANDARNGQKVTVGKLNVLVRSLEDVKSEGDAKKVLEEVGADYIVWSAGEFLLMPSCFLTMKNGADGNDL
jgi:hypothetical protein